MPIERSLKKRIKEFCLKWGRTDAEKRLRDAGLSLSMSRKLLSENYDHMPDEFRMRALIEALNKNK